MLSGKTNGLEWKVEVMPTADNNRYFAITTVAQKMRRTEYTYRNEDAAKDAGCYLLSKMLAEARNYVASSASA